MLYIFGINRGFAGEATRDDHNFAQMYIVTNHFTSTVNLLVVNMLCNWPLLVLEPCMALLTLIPK